MYASPQLASMRTRSLWTRSAHRREASRHCDRVRASRGSHSRRVRRIVAPCVRVPRGKSSTWIAFPRMLSMKEPYHRNNAFSCRLESGFWRELTMHCAGASRQSGRCSALRGHASNHRDAISVRGDNVSVHWSAVSVCGGNVSIHWSAVSVRGGNVSIHWSAVPVRGGNVSIHWSAVPVRGGNASMH